MAITKTTAPDLPISHGTYHDQSRVDSASPSARSEPMIGIGLANLKEDWLGLDSELDSELEGLGYDLLAKDVRGGEGNLSETGHGNVHKRASLQMSEDPSRLVTSTKPTEGMSVSLVQLFTKLYHVPLSIFLFVFVQV